MRTTSCGKVSLFRIVGKYSAAMRHSVVMGNRFIVLALRWCSSPTIDDIDVVFVNADGGEAVILQAVGVLHASRQAVGSVTFVERSMVGDAAGDTVSP